MTQDLMLRPQDIVAGDQVVYLSRWYTVVYVDHRHPGPTVHVRDECGFPYEIDCRKPERPGFLSFEVLRTRPVGAFDARATPTTKGTTHDPDVAQSRT